VVDNINAPSYKLAKYTQKKLQDLTKLSNTYNISNSIDVAHQIVQLKCTHKYRMITLDIKDLYVNIPIQDVIQITNMILQYNNKEIVLKQQTAHALNTILLHNYFQYKNNIYQPNKGIAMGSPISGIIAEIFLQHFENLLIKHHLENRSLIYYTTYVDDILIIYDTTKIQYHRIIQQANMIHKNLTFNYTL
jgi:hypothetical protein